jgi:hypothetical protein
MSQEVLSTPSYPEVQILFESTHALSSPDFPRLYHQSPNNIFPTTSDHQQQKPEVPAAAAARTSSPTMFTARSQAGEEEDSFGSDDSTTILQIYKADENWEEGEPSVIIGDFCLSDQDRCEFSSILLWLKMNHRRNFFTVE